MIILQESCMKDCKTIIFVQDFDEIFKKIILRFSCKIIARFFYLAKKAIFLVQDLQDMCTI